MNFTTHTASGAAAGVWLAVALQPSPGLALVGVGVAALGSMGPDLDHLDSTPTKAGELFRIRIRKKKLLGWTWFKGWTWRVGPGSLLSWLLRLVSKTLTGRKHRGICHSLLFAVVVGCLAALGANYWLPAGPASYLGLAAFTGVVAALLGDVITKDSLKHLFWPLLIKMSIPVELRVRGGGTAEKVVLFLVSALGLWGLVIFGGTGA